MATRISVTVNDAVTQSAAKLGVQLKEKQREALLGFCLGKDVFVSLPTQKRPCTFLCRPFPFAFSNWQRQRQQEDSITPATKSTRASSHTSEVGLTLNKN